MKPGKSFDQKLVSGFWDRYITGPFVLDIGFRGYEREIVPIIDGAIGVDLDYPGYDGTKLPFDDASQDTVYSSHCLEHIPNYLQVISDWYRVTKVGGHIITIVPNAMLYERKRRPPSRRAGWNYQRFYTPQSLLAEFESALRPNSYRVRHLAENDANYSYGYDMDRHPDGCYEIELVIEKIATPKWGLDEQPHLRRAVRSATCAELMAWDGIRHRHRDVPTWLPLGTTTTGAIHHAGRKARGFRLRQSDRRLSLVCLAVACAAHGH